MKIGIVSDIHCNIAGLDRALAEIGDVDELICAGDLIYQFRFSNEVVERLREHGARIILGNHEETFYSAAGVRAQQAPWIHADTLAYLAEQPLTRELQLDGKRLLVVHGSPWEPHREYLYPNSPALRRFAQLDADIVVMGHTHFQMAERVGHALLVNPGSAGDPRDPRNDFQLSAAILDTETEIVEFRNFADPARIAAATALESSSDAWASQGGNVGFGHDQAAKAEPDAWSGSLST